MKKGLILLGVLVMIGAILVPAAMPASEPQAKVFKWKAQTSFAAGSLNFKGAEAAMNHLRRMTNGRLDIRCYGTGAIVASAEVTPALGKGAFEVGSYAPAYDTGLDPGLSIFFSIPSIWGINDVREMRIWYDQFGGGKMLREAYDKYNIYWVGPTFNGAEPIFSKVPLRKIEDFKGIKIRTIAGITADVVTRLGAKPTFIPGGDTYGALNSGVVDAAEWISLAEDVSMGLHEVTKYVLYPSFHCPAGMTQWSVNKDTWNQLPDDLKAAFEAIIPILDINYDYWAQAADYDALTKIKAKGLVHTQLSAEDNAKIRQISLQVTEAYKTKSPLADKAITSIVNYLKLTGTLK